MRDDFHSSGEDGTFGDALLSETFEEGSVMLAKDERMINWSGTSRCRAMGSSWEVFEKYADCPRLTEYVVRCVPHPPPCQPRSLPSSFRTQRIF